MAQHPQQVDANFLKARFRQTLANDGTPLPPPQTGQRKTREQIREEMRANMKSKGIPCVSEDADMDDTFIERVNAPARPARTHLRHKPLHWKKTGATTPGHSETPGKTLPASSTPRNGITPKTTNGAHNHNREHADKNEAVLKPFARLQKKPSTVPDASGKLGKDPRSRPEEMVSPLRIIKHTKTPKKSHADGLGKAQNAHPEGKSEPLVRKQPSRTVVNAIPQKLTEGTTESFTSESDSRNRKPIPLAAQKVEVKDSLTTPTPLESPRKSPPKEDVEVANEKKDVEPEADVEDAKEIEDKQLIARVAIDAEEVEAKKAALESVDEMDLQAQKQAEEQQNAAINDVDPIWIPCAVQILRFIHKEKALEGAMTKKENEMLAKFFAGMLAYNDKIMVVISNALEKIFDYAKEKNVKVPNKNFYDNKILAKKAIFDALITNPQYLPSSWKTQFQKWREEADRERYGINLIKILTTYPKQRSFDDSEVKNDGTFTPKARNLFWGVIIGPSDQKSFEETARDEAAKGIYFAPTLADNAIAAKSLVTPDSASFQSKPPSGTASGGKDDVNAVSPVVTK